MIEAASAYIEKDDKVLTIERESGKYKGCRSMPHGIVEEGEKPQNTVVRETKEETGYDVRVLRRLFVYEGKFGPKHGKFSNQPVHIHVFECEITGGKLKTYMNPNYIFKKDLSKRKDVVPSLKITIEYLKT